MKRTKTRKYQRLIYPVVLYVLLLSLILSVFGLAQSLMNKESKLFDINQSEIGYYSLEYISCANMSLVDTAYCLNNYVSGFYNYNQSNINNNLDLGLLKKEGGVCWHYADLYSALAKGYGFQEQQINIPRHVFTIIYDDSGYCELDQLNVNCITYGNTTTKEVIQNGNT